MQQDQQRKTIWPKTPNYNFWMIYIRWSIREVYCINKKEDLIYLDWLGWIQDTLRTGLQPFHLEHGHLQLQKQQQEHKYLYNSLVLLFPQNLYRAVMVKTKVNILWEKKLRRLICKQQEVKNKLTRRRASVLKKKRVYPTKFRFLVSILASLYARSAIVPNANGW